MAHENLDVINMAIRKQTASKLAAGNKPTASVCFVNEQSRIHGSKRSARTVDTVRKRVAVTAVASHSMLQRGYLNKLLVVHPKGERCNF